METMSGLQERAGERDEMLLRFPRAWTCEGGGAAASRGATVLTGGEAFSAGSQGTP